MQKRPAGTFTPEILAREIINVMAENGLFHSAVDIVFEHVKKELARQKIKTVDVKEGFDYPE